MNGKVFNPRQDPPRLFSRLLLWLAFLSLMASPPFASAAEDVALYDHTFPSDATEIVLDDARIHSADKLIEKLAAFPALARVSLERCGLTAKQLSQLQAAYPGVEFHSVFVCFGQTVSTDDTYINIGKNVPKRKSELETFLDVMPNLQRLDMYGYSISVEAMEALMEHYPHVSFGWTVHVPKSRTLPSNATAYSTRHSHAIEKKMRNTSEDFSVLIHCPDLVAIDLGHNAIDDLSFLAPYQDVKVLILADNRITDISQLAAFTQLEYLELFMNDISDLTPLSQLDKLKDLNLCYNEISDITPLLSLTQLERCWISNNRLTEADQALLIASLPNTRFEFTARLSTQNGWRDGEHYETIAEMFKAYTYLPFSAS